MRKLTFIDKKNGNDTVFHKRVEILIDDDDNQNVVELRYDDIIKDDKLKDLTYFFDFSSYSDLYKLIKLYNYKFSKFDKDTKKLYLEEWNELNKREIDQYDYFIMKNIESITDSEFILDDTIFDVEDLDYDKLKTFKDIAKSFDTVKVIEYDKDDENNIINANTFLNSKNSTLNYVFDLSILNEVFIIHDKKLYVLNVPIGLEYRTLGITDNKNNYLVKYKDESINLKDKHLVLDIDKCIKSNVKITSEYIMSNTFMIVENFQIDTLNKYALQMKKIFDMDIILGIYDL